MLTLVQFGPCWGIPSPSPFCLKVETFLRMAAVEYRVEHQSDPRSGPKGKLPYIKDKGVSVPDSGAILEYMIKNYDVSLDTSLTEKQVAEGTAVKRLCEDHLYWALVYSRWVDEEHWPRVKKEFFGKLPPLIRPVISAMARKSLFSAIDGQGFGRDTKQEVYAKGVEDISALAILLGDGSYFFGDQPSSYDATVYGVLGNILYSPFQTPMVDALKHHSNLVSYCERIKTTYFAEY